MTDETLQIGQRVQVRDWLGIWAVEEIHKTPVPEGDLYFVRHIETGNLLGIRASDVVGEGRQMKYEPRYSNFDEMQDEIAERLLEAKNTLEDVKDAIAKEVDEYVEAILKERIEQVKVTTILEDDPCPIHVMFSAGDKIDSRGRVDLFKRKVPLAAILDEFDWWDELDEYDPDYIRSLEATMRSFADRLGKVAFEADQANEKNEREFKEQLERGEL